MKLFEGEKLPFLLKKKKKKSRCVIKKKEKSHEVKRNERRLYRRGIAHASEPR